MLFSSAAFAFHSQSYICRSASNGSILFGGNSPNSQIPAISNLCHSIGGTLSLGAPNNGPTN